tara:strand:- start:2678 stop:3502 length:825 start_codon:yes stop_codon:yes gene_type:complete
MLPRSFKEYSVTDVQNKLVLVTGACGGFGEHMVKQFLDRNCRLIVTDIDELQIAHLKEANGSRDGEITTSIAADLSASSGCTDLFKHCEARELVPDVLINNAGIAVAGRHDRVPQNRWETLLNLNLFAPMRLTSLFLPKMLERESGHIVNISSLAGWIGAPNLSAYVASKFGLRGFGESLAAETAKRNVQVSNVYPSFSRTPILDSEQFGMGERKLVPDNMISDPADVVANIIKGMERDRLHIFPDRIALQGHYLKRFAPWAIPFFSRHIPTDG